MSKTALLVIDVQESFRQRPYWNDAGLSGFVTNQQALIDGCIERKIPVVQILHNEEQGAFALSSGFVTTMEPIKIKPDVVIHKRYHSALAGTPLSQWLNERGIHRLIISGIRTEECCETTTRHASDLGFAVDYAIDATLTFPIKHARTGRVFSPAEIKERTELVLTAGEFAKVVSVEEALARL